MNQDTYRRIVSGHIHRWWVPALKGMLYWLSLVYSLGIRIRNIGYNIKFLRSYSASVPIISVGNITAGGTGKTPLVIWLCKYLHHQGIKSAILTRGYKTRPGAITDEPALLARACADATVVVNPDRVAGAKKAIYHQSSKVLVMDDGFQHRRLKRDIDIIVMDATCPFGYDRILPAGLLREPKTSLARASAVVITRADLIDPSKLREVEAEIKRYTPNIPIAKTIHKITGAVGANKQKIGLDELRDKPVFAFCGIGNPDAFFESLQSHSMKLVGTQVFDDHHIYSIDDMETMASQAKNCGAEIILCTQKDWVKSAMLLPADKEGPISGYIAMELDFIEGRDTICALIDTVTAKQSALKEED